MKSHTHRQLRRFAAPGFLSAVLLAATGCGSTLRQIDLDKSGPVRVSLRYVVEGGHPRPQGYGHPARLAPEEVKKMLGAVGFEEYSYLKWRDQGPLFNEDEILLLAPKLAEGLQKATADQWVYFSVSGMHNYLVFSSGHLSDGICFVKDGKFNLVLGNIRFTTSEQTGGVSEPSRIDPRDLKTFDYARLTVNKGSGPGVAPPPVVPGDRWFGTERLNWLVFDLATFLVRAPEQPPTTAAPAAAPVTAPAAAAATPSAPAPVAAPTAVPATAPAAATAPGAAVPSPSLDPGERLIRLKDLRDRGLITADEYEKKRQEILKGL